MEELDLAIHLVRNMAVPPNHSLKATTHLELLNFMTKQRHARGGTRTGPEASLQVPRLIIDHPEHWNQLLGHIHLGSSLRFTPIQSTADRSRSDKAKKASGDLINTNRPKRPP